WDLARATGQDETLDPERCAMTPEGMRSFEGVLRSSGQYGPKVEVPDELTLKRDLLVSSDAILQAPPSPLSNE
ncbi:MAG: hypothetical protein ACR2GB_07335, partial [Nocardioidaceae bacterium]